MVVSSSVSRRVLRGIEVRDLLGAADGGRRSYTEEDLAESYRRGVADARITMTAEREDAVRSMAVALQESVSAQSRALDELRAHYRGRVVDDAFAFASWLVCREINADPSIMRVRVEDALAGIEDQAPVLTVAPSMIDLVETWLPSATVRPDDSLLAGEVRVVSASTTIDGTFADALSRLHRALDSDPGAEVPR